MIAKLRTTLLLDTWKLDPMSFGNIILYEVRNKFSKKSLVHHHYLPARVFNNQEISIIEKCQRIIAGAYVTLHPIFQASWLYVLFSYSTV